MSAIEKIDHELVSMGAAVERLRAFLSAASRLEARGRVFHLVDFAAVVAEEIAPALERALGLLGEFGAAPAGKGEAHEGIKARLYPTTARKRGAR